jgi:hypothetical protein
VTDRRIHRFTYRCAKNPFPAETLDHYHNLAGSRTWRCGATRR